MIEGFNLQEAVKGLVQPTLSQFNGQRVWDQKAWGSIELPDDWQGDLVIDDATGQPVGIGSCSTAHCLGGWVCHNNDVSLRWEHESQHRLRAYYTVEGEGIHRVACDLLGIPIPDAEDGDDDRYYADPEEWTEAFPHWDFEHGYPYLFHPDNTLDELYRYVADYAGITVDEVTDLVYRQIGALR